MKLFSDLLTKSRNKIWKTFEYLNIDLTLFFTINLRIIILYIIYFKVVSGYGLY